MNMMPKKQSKVIVVIGALIVTYISYFLAGCCFKGATIFDIYDNALLHMKTPFADYRNEYTLKGIIIGVVIYGFYLLYKMTEQRNYMPGREYGSMKFIAPQMLNKTLQDKKNKRDGANIKAICVDRKIPFAGFVNKIIYVPPKVIYVNTNNRRLSENVNMSLNTRQHGLNDNMLVTGGSGSGKTFYVAKPNILNMGGSFIITDPKGELLRDTGSFLEKMGYQIKVFNVLDADGMKNSTRYNPFVYLKSETDVLKMVTAIFESTDDKNATKGEPFWDNSGKMLLKALIYYVWMEMPKEKMNFNSVLNLLEKAEFKTNKMGMKMDSELDIIFKKLEQEELEKIADAKERGEERLMHPAVSAYNSVMKGAADTVRSIIITLDAKLDNFKTKEMRDLLSVDELNVPEIGCGVNMDSTTKTALFCVIPDNDTTFNFLISMMYTQVFQQLYYIADFIYGGRLPLHVTFLLDEFANVSLPDNYIRLLSTMRSREISCIIIIQNKAQLKELFEKGYQSIPGNCDTQIFLGSGEEETGESISKSLGKGTIDKKTSGETLGRQGSSSRNYDKLGRELMMPEEVRLMDNKKCLVFVRGQLPCLDDKTRTFKHPLYHMLGSDKKPYIFKRKAVESENVEKNVSLETIRYQVKDSKRNGQRTEIFSLTAEELLSLDTSKKYNSPREYFSKKNLEDNKRICDKKRNITLERRRNDMNIKQKIAETFHKEKESEKSLIERLKSNPEMVKNLLKLKSDGYNVYQLEQLTELIVRDYKYSDIKQIFNTAMAPDEIKESVDILLMTL